MHLHATRLLESREVARETLAIRLERPEAFDFTAGQYADLTLNAPAGPDPRGPSRSMSIVSAPAEDTLEFVMRVRGSPFKHALQAMPPGGELRLEGPFDDLRFRDDPEREVVMIAGGVGVAPFVSILRQHAAEGRGLRATLFYSNRRPEDAVYLDELRRREQAVEGFRLVPVLTRAAQAAPPLACEAGRIDLALLERHLTEIVGPAYYLAGSPGLVSGIRRSLLAAGVPDVEIGIEAYAGY